MITPLTLNLLGEVTICLGDESILGLRSRTAEALLIYLACEQRPFSRQYLAEFFWEARNPEQSAANLRAALSMLRKQVGDYLLITRQTVAFNGDLPYRLDVVEFTTAAARLQTAVTSAVPAGPQEIAALETAVALYGGAFLNGYALRESRDFEEWNLVKREQLQQQATLLLRRLIAALLAAGRSAAALDHADHLLRLNPFSEWAHRQKMLALARGGQLQAALRQYQRCQALLLDEFGAKPNPETAALAGRIRAAAQAPRHNLPPAPTPFIGRAPELADLEAQLLNPACRLLTIIGPGGAGKTRLALEAARRLIPSGYFLNGLRFIPLADAAAPDLIPNLIAAELGLALQGNAPPAEQLAAALAGQELLLVLDNLEHLMEGETAAATADLLANLLAKAPLVTLLVTSRSRLYLREERLFDVSGLDLPAEGASHDALQTGAVQLFLQTAQSIQRHFSPSEADLAAIVAICRTLEGLPLGIELAAVWLPQLSCAAIADKLRASSALLATSLRNVPARHRSLTAVFDHSWALLPPARQAIFARLALFRGGCTAAAAQAIAGASLDDLAALGAQSLLRQESGRYTLHELLRHYAAEKLAQSDAATAVAQAHAAYFFDYLSKQGSGEEMGQRQAIRTELANIRAAWETTAAHGNEAALLPAAATLHNFYSAESRFHEGIDVFQYALEPPDRPKETAVAGDMALSAQLRADLLGRKARLHIHVGQLEAARQALDGAMQALQQVDDPDRLATILGYVAITAFYAGEFPRAILLAEESLALATTHGDQDGVAFALNFLGSCHKALGDYAAAADAFTRAVTAYEQLGDELGQAMTLNNLGNLAQAQGDLSTARAHYTTCSRLFQKHNHNHGAATTLANAGRLALRQGDYAQARRQLAESLALKQALNDARGMGVALAGLGAVSVATGAYAQARDELVRALELAQKSGDAKLAVEALAPLAAWHGRQGDRQTAAQLVAFVRAHQAASQEIREQIEKVAAELGGVTAVAPALSLDELISQLRVDLSRDK